MKLYRKEEGLHLVYINKDYKDIHITYDENLRIIWEIVGNVIQLEEQIPKI